MKTQKDFRDISDSVSVRVMKALRKAVSRKRSGFTLAELIVVVTILAILATVGFLALSGYSRDAGESAAKANVRSVLTAVRSESAITGNSPRRYVIHDSSLSWVALSWAFVEFDGNRTYLTWGAWNAPWTNYSAGNPDWAALKIDPSKFRTSASGLFSEATAAYDPKSVVLASAEATYPPSVTGRSLVRSFTQAAAFLPSGTAYVTGDVPAFSTASGASLGLVRDPGSPSLTWAVTDSSSVALPSTFQQAENAYQISNSLRLRSEASANLSRTPTVSWNLRKWTYSTWVKRWKLASNYPAFFGNAPNGAGNNMSAYFTPSDTIHWTYNNSTVILETNAVFRDPSAWYNIVLVWDSDNATLANKARVYVNGAEITSFSTNGRSSIGWLDSSWNKASVTHYLFGSSNAVINFDGYASETNFVDGQALDPGAFGEADPTSWSWKPKQYSGAYGTGGFRMDFSSWATVAGLGLDSAPIEGTWHVAKNHWTPSGITVTDQMIDNPTNNFATLNPLQTGGYSTLTAWNLRSAGNTTTNSAIAASTVSSSAGKWYWEATQWTVSTEMVGVATKPISNHSALLNAEVFPWTYGIGARYNGYVNGISGETQSVTAFTWTNGDVIGVAVDADNGAIYFSKNGTWLNGGVPDSGTAKTGAFSKYSPDVTRTITPTLGSYNGGNATANFGQGGSAWLQYCAGAGWWFKTCPPEGFKAFSTANLPTPAIANPKLQFDVLGWMGDGAANRTISGLSFQPDMVWEKNRTSAVHHNVYDSVRWAGTALVSRNLQTSNLDGEAHASSNDGIVSWYLSAFSHGGFSMAKGTGTHYYFNASGQSEVAWCWKAGGTAVANASGTMASQVSANPTSGFSIITYSGNWVGWTIGHWLSKAPEFIITKSRNSSGHWTVYHQSMNGANPEYGYLNLNLSQGFSLEAAWAGRTRWWQNVQPGPTTFTIGAGSSDQLNVNGSSYVAYAFNSVSGYSKFGSYVGNWSTGGPFVNLGFRPRFIMMKRSSTSWSWAMMDTVRESVNDGSASTAYADLSQNGDAGSNSVEFLSNGFKIRDTWTATNSSWDTYVYAAFAEAPFWGSGMAPATAR